MTFAGFKKQITKANQLFSEKIGNAKATELEVEYIENEKKIDSYKNLFDDMLSKVSEFLQPNPAFRTKLMTQNAFHKLAGKSGQKPMYPQTEGQIAEILAKHSNEIGTSLFGKMLSDCGDTFKDLEELKYSLEDQVKQNFIEPLTNVRHQGLKEISVHRKKVQSRRLTYDALKRKKESGSKVADVELEDAETKFEEAKQLTTSAINNFLDSEVEHINIIGEWIKAEREYHHHAADLCESLYSKILMKRDEAKSIDHSLKKSAVSSPSSKSKTWNNNEFSNSADSDKSYPKAPFVIKKASDSPKSTATCRAIYDFKAESPNELSFQEGEVIKLLQKIDDNWFEGEIHGKTGFFPINFVEVLIPLKD